MGQVVFPNQGLTEDIARRKDDSRVEMNAFMVDLVVCRPLKERVVIFLHTRDIRNGDFDFL